MVELVVEVSILAAAAAAMGVWGVVWAWVWLEAAVVAGELVVVARGVVVVLSLSMAAAELVLDNQSVFVKPGSDSGALSSGQSDCVKPDSDLES